MSSLFRRTTLDGTRCPACGYPAAGGSLTIRCSECGTNFRASSIRTIRPLIAGSYLGGVGLAIGVCLSSFISTVYYPSWFLVPISCIVPVWLVISGAVIVATAISVRISAHCHGRSFAAEHLAKTRVTVYRGLRKNLYQAQALMGVYALGLTAIISSCGHFLLCNYIAGATWFISPEIHVSVYACASLGAISASASLCIAARWVDGRLAEVLIGMLMVIAPLCFLVWLVLAVMLAA